MEALLAPFLSFLLLYKYLAIFLVSFAAAFAIPIPASTLLVAAGAFAYQDFLSYPLVIIVALVANVAGDALGFLLARRYGETALLKIGLGRLLRSKHYHRFSTYIHDFPQSLIFISRFVTELGPMVNLIAGLTKVRPLTFFIFDVLGETGYVLYNVFLGYALGSEWENNIGFLVKAFFTVLPFVIIINLIQIYLYKIRTKK